jgi:tRNA (guanine37-N1)-methyltransferase
VNIDVFTLFPEAFEWFTAQRHVSNLLGAGSRLEFVNYRDHTPLSGRQVDDTPFGGGAGMVLRVDVLDSALRAHYGVDPVELRAQRRVIALAPGGRMLEDRLVDELAADVVSIGRYVLSGGELAAMVLCDAVSRKLPGALGDHRSAAEESFSVALEGHPEYPHYTRPAEYRGWRVPEVLLSGHHERIAEWRRERSRERGEASRPGASG